MGRLRAISAMSENRVIGDSGRIPWHLPADFRWFRQVTLGGILLMGRKTFESIGKPLPGRQTIVLTRSAAPIPGVRTASEIEPLLEELQNDPRPVWVCGGAEIYRLLLPLCGDLFLTRVPITVTGDVVSSLKLLQRLLLNPGEPRSRLQLLPNAQDYRAHRYMNTLPVALI
jgi:dihydrofolate reductase